MSRKFSDAQQQAAYDRHAANPSDVTRGTVQGAAFLLGRDHSSDKPQGVPGSLERAAWLAGRDVRKRLRSPSRWKQYPDELGDTSRGVHVTIEYQTQGGDAGTWSRWTEADDMEEALDAASEHVATFKRVGKIYGGSAAPYRNR